MSETMGALEILADLRAEAAKLADAAASLSRLTQDQAARLRQITAEAERFRTALRLIEREAKLGVPSQMSTRVLQMARGGLEDGR